MKRHILNILMIVSSSALILSCQRELDSDRCGYLSFSLSRDMSEELVLKSETTQAEEAYMVEIYNSSGELVKTIEDHRTVTEAAPVELMIGRYRIVARNEVVPDGSFDADYYCAETEVSVRADEMHRIDLTATRADCKLSVSFPDEFADHFKKYQVSVTNNASGVQPLVLSNVPDVDDTRQAGLSSTASFPVTGELTWSLYMENNDHVEGSGGTYTHTKTYTEVKPGQRYHLIFSLAEDTGIDGALALRVVVDGETIDEKHDVILDFDKTDMPSYSTNEGFDLPDDDEFLTVIMEDATDKKIFFDTPAGLKSLLLSHYDASLLAAGVPERVEFVDDGMKLSAIGITAGGAVGSKEAEVNVTTFVSKLPEGRYEMFLTAIDAKGRFVKVRVAFEIVLDVDAEIVSAEPWAMFANVTGRYFKNPAPEGLTFQYRRADETEWTTSDVVVKVNDVTLRYTARIDGLDADSRYIIRAVSAADIADGKEGKTQTFTTEAAPVLLNMGFDSWYQDGSVYYPNVNLDGDNYVWDTANGGTSSVNIYPTSPESEHLAVPGENKQAAKLTSLDAPLVGLAAGNIYTGQFVKANMSISNPGAQLDWGTPFTGRPLALRGWVDYQPGNIDVYDDSVSDKIANGAQDIGQVQVLLTDWTNKFRINTSEGTFVKFDTDEKIIAYSYLDINATDGYIQFTLPITYRALDRIPTYIVIVGSASKYGDYFTGSTSSVMYLDDFEFIYDPAQLSAEEYDAVFANFN